MHYFVLFNPETKMQHPNRLANLESQTSQNIVTFRAHYYVIFRELTEW